jgi:putative transposase
MTSSTLPLPRGWTETVRAAVLHVISLARFSLACAEGQLDRHHARRSWLRADNDQLRQELALVREELRIKDARMSRLTPQKRPHYLPTERMAILALRAARGWTVDDTAAAFHVTPLTIRDWMGRLETEGTEKFLDLGTPVNTFPDFVRETVQQLKVLCPRLGKRKIAETLARAGLHLGATTVRRMLREFPKPKRVATPTADERAVSAKTANDVWHADLTTVPTLLGMWCTWLPFALTQCWPFCYWVAIVMDHHSRRVQGVATFDKQPTGREVRQFFGRVIRQSKARPQTIVVDKGAQFWCRGFKSWCKQKQIKPRFGAVGRRGSVALVERLIRTLKGEFLPGLLVPGRRQEFQRALESFVRWFNAHRPHSSLGGQTPNEIYFRCRPANRRPRLEPRTRLPRGSPCAEPQTRVKGKCGARFTLHLRFQAGLKQLPIVTLRKAA